MVDQINKSVGRKTYKTRLSTLCLWVHYYCYGKWVGGYFHPSSLEIREIEIKPSKGGILNNSWPQEKEQ